MKAVQKRMAKIGYTALGEPAFLKDKGTSAGILILAPSRWSPVPLQKSVKAAVCQGSQLGRRWSAVFDRFTKTVVMFVEAYLVSGEGFRGQNLEILKQLQTLVKLVAVPTLIAADWQNEPYQMDALQWAGQNRMAIWSTGSLATCSAGPC